MPSSTAPRSSSLLAVAICSDGEEFSISQPPCRTSIQVVASSSAYTKAESISDLRKPTFLTWSKSLLEYTLRTLTATSRPWDSPFQTSANPPWYSGTSVGLYWSVISNDFGSMARWPQMLHNEYRHFLWADGVCSRPSSAYLTKCGGFNQNQSTRSLSDAESVETFLIYNINKGLRLAMVELPGREPSSYLNLVTFQERGRDQGGAFMCSELTIDQKIPIWGMEEGRGRWWCHVPRQCEWGMWWHAVFAHQWGVWNAGVTAREKMSMIV